MISVDSEEVNLGTIKQGTKASAKYVFKVKNTGDSVLVIRDVRPG
jgi:archaellum component FlaG (FlaF/FlaG flagellin family)